MQINTVQKMKITRDTRDIENNGREYCEQVQKLKVWWKLIHFLKNYIVAKSAQETKIGQ